MIIKPQNSHIQVALCKTPKPPKISPIEIAGNTDIKQFLFGVVRAIDESALADGKPRPHTVKVGDMVYFEACTSRPIFATDGVRPDAILHESSVMAIIEDVTVELWNNDEALRATIALKLEETSRAEAGANGIITPANTKLVIN